MSETVIRTEYLIPLIEWHIASEHNWNITTNKYGRLFKKYLNQEMWTKTEQTFWYMAAFFRQVKIGVLTLTLEKKQ